MDLVVLCIHVALTLPTIIKSARVKMEKRMKEVCVESKYEKRSLPLNLDISPAYCSDTIIARPTRPPISQRLVNGSNLCIYTDFRDEDLNQHTMAIHGLALQPRQKATLCSMHAWC